MPVNDATTASSKSVVNRRANGPFRRMLRAMMLPPFKKCATGECNSLDMQRDPPNDTRAGLTIDSAPDTEVTVTLRRLDVSRCPKNSRTTMRFADLTASYLPPLYPEDGSGRGTKLIPRRDELRVRNGMSAAPPFDVHSARGPHSCGPLGYCAPAARRAMAYTVMKLRVPRTGAPVRATLLRTLARLPARTRRR